MLSHACILAVRKENSGVNWTEKRMSVEGVAGFDEGQSLRDKQVGKFC